MYKSTDIFFSSVLIALGAEYMKTEVTKGLKKQGVFVLNAANLDVEALLRAYKQKKLMVDAYTLISVFKDLKSRLYETLNTITK